MIQAEVKEKARNILLAIRAKMTQKIPGLEREDDLLGM